MRKDSKLKSLYRAMLHKKLIREEVIEAGVTEELADLWKDMLPSKTRMGGYFKQHFKCSLQGFNGDKERLFIHMFEDDQSNITLQSVMIGPTERCDVYVPEEDDYMCVIMHEGLVESKARYLLYKTPNNEFYCKKVEFKDNKLSVTDVYIESESYNNPLLLLKNKWLVKNTSNPNVRLVLCQNHKCFYLKREKISNGEMLKVSTKCVVIEQVAA